MQFRVGADFDLKQSCGKLYFCLRAGPGKYERSKLEDYQKENKRLKMENQLPRDFLSLTERMCIALSLPPCYK